MRRSLSLLDVRLQVDCDDPALIEPFFAVFSGPRRRRDPGASREVSVRIDAVAGSLRTGGRTLRLAEGAARRAHVYNLLYRTLARSIERAYLLHAAAVTRGGQALLLAGPSGAGKTSLARALLRRGFRLLGDDLAPLGHDDGRVHPFPRRIGIVRGTVSQERRGRGGVELGDKEYVEPEQLGVELESDPVPAGMIVLLNPYVDGAEQAVEVFVGLVGDGTPLLRRVEGVAGVEVQREPPTNDLTRVRLRLRGAGAFRAVEQALGDADGEVLYHLRGYGSRKRYADRPLLRPVSAREASLELLRETLNREPSSRLMARHSGGLARALFELGGLIRGVSCFRLTPAEVEDTATLLSERFEHLGNGGEAVSGPRPRPARPCRS